ncbi:MAG TPA: hypothetical protein VJQ82_03140, partial [Terriglobales bacterium]|nr:hypothetical protein [Terriglobales bacterium]
MLEAPVQERLKSAYEQLLTEGSLPSLEKLKECYRTFRERFGPEALRGMDGEELLNTMHAHGSRDSLVYWLEFKNDQEFPDYFGSIAGGSALKFGIYKRRETGAWMIDRGQGQEEISLREAITVARSNRDQLAAGAQVLDQFAAEAPDDNYTRMQGKLAAESPRVFNTAWGHKYFSLLFPEKLDDFHVEDFQRFYIRKMLQIPPTTDGRYSAAGRYVDAAGRLRIPMNHLSTTLRQTYGRPYRVWRIGTRLGGTNSIWELMKDGGCIAIGWPVLGDLSTLPEGSAARDELRKKLEEDEEIPTVAGRNANQIFAFLRKIDDDDLVVAADGEQILG